MTMPFDLTTCQVVSSDGFESLDHGAYLMEPKIDGWRMQIDVTPDWIQAWTRTQKDATHKMPMAQLQLRLMAKTHRMRLDGEAVYINEDGTPDYNFTSRALGSGVEVCIAKQQEEGKHLTYCVFDILSLDGHDLRSRSLEYRKALIERFLSPSRNIHLVQGTTPSHRQHATNVDTFKEGSVLKLLNSSYAGKRHKSWLKWKEIETVDVKIIGYKHGQGKYEGLIGAIRFEAPDGTVGYCSGMDDSTRIYISDHREALDGAIFEVKHFGRLVDGFRHPQFMRFRSDRMQ